MPDDNLTPSQRQQNRIDTDRGLRDNGIRLEALRGSLIDFQTQARATPAPTAPQVSDVVAPPPIVRAPATSFPARPFTPAAQESARQTNSPTGSEVAGFIVIDIDPVDMIPKVYTNCVFTCILGPEAT